MFPKPSPDRPLSLNSYGIPSKESWRHPEPKTTHGASTTAVNGSDDKVKNSLSAAGKDIDLPWGYHIAPVMLEASFINALDERLDKFKTQPVLSNEDHHRAHGGHSHKTSSRRPGERSRRGQNTGQDAAKSSGGGGGKDSKGRGTDAEPPPDGLRYPPSSEAQLRKFFGCPFYMNDPVRFHECSNRLRRLSDVSQHIERRHLLQEVKLSTTHREPSGINGATCTDPNLVRLYHPVCRREFYGPSAEDNLRRHLAGGCNDVKTIEDTGVLLPREFRDLLSKRDRATGGVAKWYAMWRFFFPPTGVRIIPVSPYVHAIVSREQAETTMSMAFEPGFIPADPGPLTSQILNEIYLAPYATDPEVREAVSYQVEQECEVFLQFSNSLMEP